MDPKNILFIAGPGHDPKNINIIFAASVGPDEKNYIYYCSCWNQWNQ